MGKIVLGLILLLSAFLRFTTVAKLMPFTPDEEYLLYIAQTLISNFHIIWIGVSALGFDFYMGPLWIYIIYPFVFIAKGDPLILGYLASALGVGATYLLYLLGKKLFTEKVGLIASVLYASSPLIIYYDQKPYPSGVPFLSLLLALSLYMTKYSNKWWILFAASYGMVFNIHLSLTLIIFVALYWGFLHKHNLNRKIILLTFLTFIITISPLIAFDYFHKASNITVPIRLIQSMGNHQTKLDFGSRFNVLIQSMGRIWYLEPYKNSTEEIVYPCTVEFATTTKPPWIFSGLTALLILYFLLKKNVWKDDRKRILLLLCLSFIIPFTILPVISPVEYYLLGFFPLVFLIMASLIASFPTRLLAPLIIIIISFGLFVVTSARGDYGLQVKKDLIRQVMNTIGSQPYDLKEEGSCHKYEGWRYLFSIYGRKPARSSEDSNFGWLYKDEISNQAVKYSVVVKETKTPLPIIKGYNYSLQEGGFTAYIFQHENQ